MSTTRTVVSAGILTRKEIEERGLIKDPQPRGMQPTSYDLSLGCDYLNSEGETLSLSDGNQLIIPRYGVVLVCTKETVRTDDRTAGRFDLKIRHALSGLVLQVGTQVEPMYTGQLFGLILNLSDKEVKIFEGDPIFTIEFHTLVSSVNKERRTIAGLKEFLRAKNIQDPVKSSLSGMEKVISDKLSGDLRQYVELLHAQWEQRSTHRWVVIFSAGFLVVSLVLGVALPVYINKTTLDRDDTLYQQRRVYQAAEQLKDDQAFQNLMKVLREHPEVLNKLLEQVQSEQKLTSPPPSIQPEKPRGQGGSGVK